MYFLSVDLVVQKTPEQPVGKNLGHFLELVA
jgi:hypothetical protein